MHLIDAYSVLSLSINKFITITKDHLLTTTTPLFNFTNSL